MIAYHFPPLAGSSGIQRTLRFVQQLPQFGWKPMVLTASPQAYEKTSGDLMADVPADTVVRRAFALDTARHLQIKGRYFGWMARPDRWVSWQFDAVRQGLKLIDEFKPDAIWSTYPIATAHVIASKLQKMSGLPWVADFRDPMAQVGYPADPVTRQIYLNIEAEAAQHARLCTFTTPGAAREYKARYPDAAERMVVLENGYDEESFVDAEALIAASRATLDGQRQKRPMVILHSGIVYPEERDPTHLFMALGQLKKEGKLTPDDLKIRFRASVHDDLLRQLASNHGTEGFIELCPAIPYREALAEMLQVDGLLVLQASNCNDQIPAKIYEYLRARKPILGLTDPAGDTAGVLREAGLGDMVARLDSPPLIAELLVRFAAGHSGNGLRTADRVFVAEASRLGRSKSLSKVLTDLGAGT